MTALAVLSRLRAQGVPARHVTPAELLMAPVICHDPLGESRIELASGLALTGATILAVLNRVRSCLPDQFLAASPADQSYAAEEAFAFLISWLTGLSCPVTNTPHPGYVAGTTPLGPVEDRLALAAGNAPFAAASRSRHFGRAAGLAPWPQNPHVADAGLPPQVIAAGPAILAAAGDPGEVLVAGCEIVGAELPPAVVGRIRDTMRQRRLDMARVTYVVTSSGHDLTGIDPLPEVRSPQEVAALTRHLVSLTRLSQVVP